MSDNNLTEEQQQIYNTINSTNDNYFVTGNAGTGKSFLLQHFIKNTSKIVAVVSPTGIAALNVEGQTIHSFFGLDTNVQDPSNSESLYRGLTEERKDKLSALDTLVIDEVSMVRVDIMDMIDAKLRVVRGDRPFGGCQIICFGDLFQLPPVVGKDKAVYQYLNDVYHTIFFFGAPVFYNHPLKRLNLTQVLRQKDNSFTRILNRIREGDNSTALLNVLNRCPNAPNQTECLTLTPTNAAARKINLEKMQSLPCQESVTYTGVIDGKFERDDIPTEEPLVLKSGAQVMFIKNDSTGKRWVNGTIAKIVSLSQNMINVYIAEKGITCSVDKEIWTKYEYHYDRKHKKLERKPVGYFTQYPLKLAYAITIHKSQGKTLESVNIDYSQGRAFDAGQTYVALSRCKSIDKLFLETPIEPSDIKVNQEVISFMNDEYQMQPIHRRPLFTPTKHNSSIPSFQWLEGNRIKVDLTRPPKKITGSRLPIILNFNKYKTPFEIWCALTHLCEIPFSGDHKYMNAGKIIEPKQFDYVKRILGETGMHFFSPADIYGSDFFNKTNGDFFKFTDIFGGMWDYLIKFSKNGSDNTPFAVLEMKTTHVKREQEWRRNYPPMYTLQGAFYAWLLGVERYYLVSSFLHDNDYKEPDKYECNENNTLIKPFKLSRQFYDKYITPTVKWWNDHIDTGISPPFDPVKDKKILKTLRDMQTSK